MCQSGYLQTFIFKTNRRAPVQQQRAGLLYLPTSVGSAPRTENVFQIAREQTVPRVFPVRACSRVLSSSQISQVYLETNMRENSTHAACAGCPCKPQASSCNRNSQKSNCKCHLCCKGSTNGNGSKDINRPCIAPSRLWYPWQHIAEIPPPALARRVFVEKCGSSGAPEVASELWQSMASDGNGDK